jgi:hypothetical protein
MSLQAWCPLVVEVLVVLVVLLEVVNPTAMVLDML